MTRTEWENARQHWAAKVHRPSTAVPITSKAQARRLPMIHTNRPVAYQVPDLDKQFGKPESTRVSHPEWHAPDNTALKHERRVEVDAQAVEARKFKKRKVKPVVHNRPVPEPQEYRLLNPECLLRDVPASTDTKPWGPAPPSFWGKLE